MGSGSGIAISYSIGHRYSLDEVLLWLWCRPIAAALNRPLAWELPHAAGVALKRKKKSKVMKDKERMRSCHRSDKTKETKPNSTCDTKLYPGTGK